MKNKIALWALTFAALPLLFSCSGKDNAPDEGVTLTPPKEASSAKTIKPKTEVPAKDKVETEIVVVEMDFLRSGSYAAEAELVGPGGSDLIAGKPRTKAERQKKYYMGTYSTSGNTYTLSGPLSGTVVIDGTTVSGSLFKGSSFQATVEDRTVAAGTLEDYVYRSWSISGMEFTLSKPTSIRKKFTFSSSSRNVSEVVGFLTNDVGVKIDAGKYAKYDVKEVSLGKNIIAIGFADGSVFPFIGSFKLGGSGTSGSLSYTFPNTVPDNEIIGRAANGSVSFEGNKLVLSLNVNLSQVTGTLKITLTAK